MARQTLTRFEPEKNSSAVGQRHSGVRHPYANKTESLSKYTRAIHSKTVYILKNFEDER